MAVSSGRRIHFSKNIAIWLFPFATPSCYNTTKIEKLYQLNLILIPMKTIIISIDAIIISNGCHTTYEL